MIIITNIIITIRIIITIIKIIKFIIGHTAKSVTKLNFSGCHVWRYISTIYYRVLQIPTLTSFLTLKDLVAKFSETPATW